MTEELYPLNFRQFVRLCAHIQMLPVLESGEETLVGGQAVMEGVMMRAPHSYCVAVRRANGEIVTEQKPLARVSEKYPIFQYPILRGLGTLGHAMALGIKALQFSANVAVSELAAKEGKTDEKAPELNGWMLAAPIAFSLLFFLFMYKFVPLFLATEVGKAVPSLHGRFAVNMMDGVIRLAIFLGFLYLISRMKDIRRMFQYHGAEHKVVFNFESGQPVTVENAQKFVTFHPRCGTSFLLLIMVLAILVYPLVPFDGFVAKLVARIALLPVIVGVSYELIRYAARHRQGLMAALTAPGLWLQRVTTKEPSDEMAAVAIHALDGAMQLEEAQGGELVIA